MNIHVFLIFYSIINTVHAQFRNYSNEFLNIGVDAAALGMSKAVVATCNDVNAIYWNPSGLATIKNYEISLMHSSYFAGIAQYNFIGFAMPLDNKSAVGFSLIRFGVDDILNTTELIDSKGNINYDKISLFSAADYAFNIAYSKKLKLKGLRFGVNTKIIRRIIGNFAASWGFGFDAGIQFERNSWKLGVMLRDITTTFNSWAINKNEFEKIKSSIPNKNQELPNATEITKMAKLIKKMHPNIPISLEMEKAARANKDELFQVLPYIDLLFISKECASSLGAPNMRDAVDLLQDYLPANVCVVCPWGEKGAAGKDAKGNIFEVPCYPPPSG